jgi:hypothetical protein
MSAEFQPAERESAVHPFADQNAPETRGSDGSDLPGHQNSITRLRWKPLVTSFANQHGRFTQIWRVGDIAIFEQHRNALLIAYEVIVVQKIPYRQAFGKCYPAHEAYPPFGKEWQPNGWSFGRQHPERAFAFAKGLIHNLGLPKNERLSSAEMLAALKEQAPSAS